MKLSWKRFWKKWNLSESWSAVRKKELPNLRSSCLKWTSKRTLKSLPLLFRISHWPGGRDPSLPITMTAFRLKPALKRLQPTFQHSIFFCLFFFFAFPKTCLYLIAIWKTRNVFSFSQNLTCLAFYSVSLQIFLQRLCFIWCSWKVLILIRKTKQKNLWPSRLHHDAVT